MRARSGGGRVARELERNFWERKESRREAWESEGVEEAQAVRADWREER
jgi:hypothetical protein